jgi:hypothetical protein
MRKNNYLILCLLTLANLFAMFTNAQNCTPPLNYNCPIYLQDFSDPVFANNGWTSNYSNIQLGPMGPAVGTINSTLNPGGNQLYCNLQSNKAFSLDKVMATSNPIPVCKDSTYTVCFKYRNAYTQNNNVPYFRFYAKLSNGSWINYNTEYTTGTNANWNYASFTFVALNAVSNFQLEVKSSLVNHYTQPYFTGLTAGASELTDINGADIFIDDITVYGPRPILTVSNPVGAFCTDSMPKLVTSFCQNNTFVSSYLYDFYDDGNPDNLVSSNTTDNFCSPAYSAGSNNAYYGVTTSVSNLPYYNNLVCTTKTKDFGTQIQQDCQCDIDVTYTPGFVSGTYTLPANATWTSPKKINCTVRIPINKVLSIINTTIEFGPNGKIIVDRTTTSTDAYPNKGGILILNSAKLTAINNPHGWTGCMWQGIEVRGYTLQASDFNKRQGVVISGGTTTAPSSIEYAKCAIYVGNPAMVGSYSGGCIDVTYTRFNNNYNSIIFDANGGKDTQSRLMNSEFNCSAPVRKPLYCDANYLTTNPTGRSFYYVKLNSMRADPNIFLNTCGFRNIDQSGAVVTNNNTTAVITSETKFGVTACNFYGVNYGVQATAITTSLVAVAYVSCSNFDYVRRGVLLSGTNSKSGVFSSSFKNGVPTSGGKRNAAIVIDNLAFGGKIDNNTIIDYEQGIIVINCNSIKVDIKNNDISHGVTNNLNGCIDLVGWNKGAAVSCNKFNNNPHYKRGISVVNGNYAFTSGTGINTNNNGWIGTSTFGDCGSGLISGNLFDGINNSSRLDLYSGSFSATGTYSYQVFPGTDFYSPTNNLIANPGFVMLPCFSGYSTNDIYCTTQSPIENQSCTPIYSFNASIPLPIINPDDNTDYDALVNDILNQIQSSTDDNITDELEVELMQALASTASIQDEISYFESIGDVDSQRKLLAIYIDNAMSSEAIQKLLQIPSDNIENISYKEYYQILLDLLLQNRTLEELTATELNMIDIIKELNVTSSSNAYSVKSEVFNEEFLIECEKLDLCDGSTGRVTQHNYLNDFYSTQQSLENERKSKAANGQLTVIADNSKLTLMPNPTNGITNAQIMIGDAAINATLVISSVDGRIVRTIKLVSGLNNVQIDTENLNSGIYFVTIQQSNKVIATEKLVVTK